MAVSHRSHGSRRAAAAIAWTSAALIAGACDEQGAAPAPPLDHATAGYAVAYRYTFRATPSGFSVSTNGGAAKPFWPVGASFSQAIPGRSPGEYAATRAQVGRWIAAVGELGANVVRTHTVQSPEFYQELRKYNLGHPIRPLFLIQGAAFLDPSDDAELAAAPNYLHAKVAAYFKDDIEKAVDVVHGRRTIPPGGALHPGNYGRAYGTYDADVTPWLLGFAIGGEFNPVALHATVIGPSGATAPHDYTAGKYLRITQAPAISVFAVRHMDHLIAFEMGRYAEQHPVGWVGWPLTDPMPHPTEPPPPASYGDAQAVDLSRLETLPAYSAGAFVAYRVDPFGPDFLLYQPDYSQASDSDGPNPLLGYLKALRAAHPNLAVLVSQTGVPSSQGCAHFAPGGMHYGGFSEAEQGWVDLRVLRTAALAGVHGALLFGTIDEWFRKTWLTAPLVRPGNRQHLWYNAASADPHFGLIAVLPGDPTRPHVIDGLDGEWAGLQPQLVSTAPLLSPRGDGFDAMRKIKDVTVDHDAGYLHLRLRVADLDPDADGKVQWDRVDYVLAFDTVDPQRGDSRLDPAGGLQVERRVEFQLRIHSDTDVQLLVDRPYDLFGVGQERHSWQLYRTVANDEGAFELVQTLTNGVYVWKKKDAKGEDTTVQLGPRMAHPIGRFRTGPEGSVSTSNMWVDLKAGVIEVRIPWGLLHVTDPSSRQVVDDDGADTSGLGTITTSGIGVMAAAYAGEAEAETFVADTVPLATAAVGADGHSKAWRIPAAGSATYSWPGWDAPPPSRERRKQSYFVLRDHLATVVPAAAWPALP